MDKRMEQVFGTQPIFSIYDSKAKVFSPVFCQANVQDALREFEAAANNKDSKIGRYPAEFQLYRVAELNLLTGRITPLELLDMVAIGSEFVKIQDHDLANSNG